MDYIKLTCKVQVFVFADNYSLKDSPIASKALRSFGIEPGPIPCNSKISASLNLDSCCKVIMPLLSNARLAGAASKERKPLSGLLSCSQTGQVGQLLLL